MWIQHFIELCPVFQPIWNFVNTSKTLLKNRNWTFSVVHFFTWKLEFVSNILSMVVDYFEYAEFDGDGAFSALNGKYIFG